MHKLNKPTKQQKQKKVAIKKPIARKASRTITTSAHTTSKCITATLSISSPLVATSHIKTNSTTQRTIATIAFPQKSLKTLQSFSKRFFSQGLQREVGTVKWFDSAKGFGFVTRPSGADLFVHFTGINSNGYRSLMEGQTVEYTVGSTIKGPAAVDVVPQQSDV